MKSTRISRHLFVKNTYEALSQKMLI